MIVRHLLTVVERLLNGF